MGIRMLSGGKEWGEKDVKRKELSKAMTSAGVYFQPDPTVNWRAWIAPETHLKTMELDVFVILYQWVIGA